MSRKVAIDASFILAHLIPDEARLDVEEWFDKYIKGEVVFVSCKLLSFEVMNAIRTAYKRKRINLSLAKKLLRFFGELEINTIPLDEKEVFAISIKKDITVYDASYIYVAKKLGIKLLSLDKKLAS